MCLVVIVGAGSDKGASVGAGSEPARTEPARTEPARTEAPVQNPLPQNPLPQNPLLQNPPVQNLPVQNLPVQNLPVQNLPAQNLLVQNPPVQNPPIRNPPVQNPPVQDYPYEITIKNPIRAMNDTMRRSGHRAQRVCACQPEITSAGRFFVIARPLPGFHWDCGEIDLAKVVAISSLLIGSSRTERSPRSQAPSR